MPERVYKKHSYRKENMAMEVYFVQENFAETIQRLSAAWRNMSEKEKDRYRVAAARQSSAGGRSKTGKATGGARNRSRSSQYRRRSTSVSFTSHLCVYILTVSIL